jgi:sugar phosphate permease
MSVMHNLEGGIAATAADDRSSSNSADLERSAIRLSAWRILPLLIGCYFIAYLDRVNLSFASLQMNKSIGLTASAYGLGAGLFFLTYCLCEIPSNLVLARVGATRWIARIVFTLGLCAAGMAFVEGRTSFYAMRLALGAAEAGFYPGILYFLTIWFPAAYRARMLGYFIAAIPISGIIGAPLSGQLLGLNGFLGLEGWQWLFIVEAAPAFLLAPLVVARLEDSPAQAYWLPEAERGWLIARLGSERSLVERKRAYTVLQCLTNGRVLFLAAIYFSNVCLLNSITFFLPQIVKSFGMSNAKTGLIVALPSLLALAALILWGRRSDRLNERYGHAAAANFVGGAALLLSVLVHDPGARIAALSVAFACTLAFTSPFWSIPGTFLTGTAAAGGIGAISALGVLGGFLSPWYIGYVKDTTGNFRIGLGSIAVLAMCFAAALFLRRPRATTEEVIE